MSFKQIFTISGLNKNQAKAARSLSRRSYAEGQVSAGSAALGVSAGVVAAVKSTAFFRGLVQAAPVVVEGGTVAGGAALVITEGTAMATVVTVAGPVVAGLAAAGATYYAARKIGQWVINSDSNTNLQKEIEAGDIVEAESAEQSASWIKEGVAFATSFKRKQAAPAKAQAESKSEAANEAQANGGDQSQASAA